MPRFGAKSHDPPQALPLFLLDNRVVLGVSFLGQHFQASSAGVTGTDVILKKQRHGLRLGDEMRGQ